MTTPEGPEWDERAEAQAPGDFPATAYPNISAAIVLLSMHKETTRLRGEVVERDQQFEGLSGTNDRIYARLESAEELVEHWHFRATHDKLTGLLNRDGLEEALDSQNPPIGALYSDGTIKPVNDRISHARGDQVIIDIADMLDGSVRPPDTIARLGGDEMIILLDRTTRTGELLRPEVQLEIVKERLTNLHEAYLLDPANADLVEVGYDLAVGGAIWQEGMTADDLIGRAESAMKVHKDELYRLKGYTR